VNCHWSVVNNSYEVEIERLAAARDKLYSVTWQVCIGLPVLRQRDLYSGLITEQEKLTLNAKRKWCNAPEWVSQKVSMLMLVTDEVIVAKISKRVGVMILRAKGFTWFVSNCMTSYFGSDDLWQETLTEKSNHEEPYESRGSRTVLWEVWGWDSPLPTRWHTTIHRVTHFTRYIRQTVCTQIHATLFIQPVFERKNKTLRPHKCHTCHTQESRSFGYCILRDSGFVEWKLIGYYLRSQIELSAKRTVASFVLELETRW